MFTDELVQVFGCPIVSRHRSQNPRPGFEAMPLCPSGRSGVLAPFAGQQQSLWVGWWP